MPQLYRLQKYGLFHATFLEIICLFGHLDQFLLSNTSYNRGLICVQTVLGVVIVRAVKTLRTVRIARIAKVAVTARIAPAAIIVRDVAIVLTVPTA